MDKESSQLIRGLEGVVAAETKLCDLDGRNGRLAYGGYDIEDLARRASFEEVCHLLWYGELPNAAQLDKTTLALIAARDIPADLVQAFRLMPKATDPMRVLQAAVAILGMSDPDTTDSSHAANIRKAIRLTSQMATAICAHHRVRSGEEPIRPASDLSHAGNFLYMLTGKRPSGVVAKAFDASLTLYAEHELNASTFTTRCIVSTQSDLHSAVAGGVGALKGPLHGGAGEAVMRTLMEIGEVANVDAFTEKALTDKRRFMGMGHRVYKAGDPRAAILKGMAEEACRQSGQFKWYEMAVKLHDAHQRGEEAHPQRRLLLGAALLLARHPRRPLHAGDRGRPHRGLDGQHHRAIRRQPPDPPPRRLHRPHPPHLHDRRQALNQPTDTR